MDIKVHAPQNEAEMLGNEVKATKSKLNSNYDYQLSSKSMLIFSSLILRIRIEKKSPIKRWATMLCQTSNSLMNIPTRSSILRRILQRCKRILLTIKKYFKLVHQRGLKSLRTVTNLLLRLLIRLLQKLMRGLRIAMISCWHNQRRLYWLYLSPTFDSFGEPNLQPPWDLILQLWPY